MVYDKPHRQFGPLRHLSLPSTKKEERNRGSKSVYLMYLLAFSLRDVFSKDIDKGGECWVLSR